MDMNHALIMNQPFDDPTGRVCVPNKKGSCNALLR